MIYVYQCIICNKVFEVIQKMTDEHMAFHCGIEAKRVWTVFQTDKDLMYQFNAEYFGPKPVNIFSRRQYKKLLKQHGLVDSTPRECLTVKPPTEADHKVRIKQFAKKMADKIYKQGAMPFVKGEVGKDVRVKQRRKNL